MSCFLYYRCASPVLTDGEYDALVEEAASGWKHLEPIRKWQLGSPDAIRATGYHVKITGLAMSAALDWHLREKGFPPGMSSRGAWKYSKKFDVHWFGAEG